MTGPRGAGRGQPEKRGSTKVLAYCPPSPLIAPLEPSWFIPWPGLGAYSLPSVFLVSLPSGVGALGRQSPVLHSLL